MSRCFSTEWIEPHAEYRRKARRIRSRFARAPRLRLRALVELAHTHDERHASATRRNATDQPAARFAQFVREGMNSPVLRYSHRASLIREAEQRGIGRFEANLIIAAVQHQVGERRATESVATSPLSWIGAAVAVVVTQGAIVVALWSLIR